MMPKRNVTGFVAAAVVALSTSTARSEIMVEGDTLKFVQKTKVEDKNAAYLYEVTRFRNEMKLDRKKLDMDQAPALALFNDLRRRVAQGIRFAVPKHKRFAVVMSYYCDMKEYGAMFPFECKTSVLVADQDGMVVGGAGGQLSRPAGA